MASTLTLPSVNCHFQSSALLERKSTNKPRDSVFCCPVVPRIASFKHVSSGSQLIRKQRNGETRKKQMLQVRMAGTATTEVSNAVPTNKAATSSVSIMVNDCSGKMGHAVAEAAVAAGLNLVPLAITGPKMGNSRVACGGVAVQIIGAEERDAVFDQVLQEYPEVIVVDYTLPAAVNSNAEYYVKRGVPFVMGTTGGDRTKLIETVQKAGNYAVIAPQMGKQVVAFQAAMDIMAQNFPGAFAGYSLKVTESHQSSKVDTSGTAKAIVEYFQKLGVKFNVDEIEKVRDASEQRSRMQVPEEYLGGHAFHTYKLLSPDGTVAFEFQHNVMGRSIYAQGTVDAVLFLAKKVKEKADRKLYNMIDVLKEGDMR